MDDPGLSRETPPSELPFGMPGSYWLEMRDFDQVAAAAKLRLPMLILQGGRDYQVTVDDDLARWKQGLAGRPATDFRIYEVDNHQFIPGTGPSTPADYGRGGHVDPDVVEDIAEGSPRTDPATTRPTPSLTQDPAKDPLPWIETASGTYAQSPGTNAKGDTVLRWVRRRRVRAVEYNAQLDALLDRARRAAATNEPQVAIEALGMAALLAPARAAIHAELGALFVQQGRIEAARSAFDRALELDSGHAAAITGIAALPERPPQRGDFAVGQEVLSNRLGPDGVLRRYTVREVKRGGFGCVYIVDGPNGSQLAFKTFNTRYLWSDEDRARFEREAATWVRLDPHPNVVTARKIEKIEGLPCLVMDYIDGGDLGFLLDTNRLTIAGALKCALQICDGMRHASDQLGLVHRDLKPSNCMVSRDGRIKVTDFGLALAMRESQEQSLALTGAPDPVRVLYTTVAGTPVYMAPEQYMVGARLGPWTDVYAFGVLLYEMLTGEVPPPGGKAKRFIAASPTAATLPAQVRQLVLRCVEPEPTDRPGDFGEVRALLASVYRRVTGKPAPRAPQADPVEAGTWLERSIAFYELRLFDDSLAAAERGLQLNPPGEGERAAKFWHVRGMALYDLGRAPEALDSYDRALELDSGQASLWVCKAAALTRLDRQAEALECDERAIELAPDFATAWKYKAVALDSLGRLEEAHTAFARAFELHPRDAQVLSAWAVNLRDRGQLGESNKMVDRALALEPRQVNAWIAKGNIMSELDRFDDALECFGRVLEIDPENPLALINRASILSQLHRHDEADAAYVRAAAIGLHRAQSSVWASLFDGWGVNLRELGRLEEALERTDQALEIAPDYTNAWANRARALHLLGRGDEAAESLDRALSIDPEDPYSLEIKALISST